MAKKISDLKCATNVFTCCKPLRKNSFEGMRDRMVPSKAKSIASNEKQQIAIKPKSFALFFMAAKEGFLSGDAVSICSFVNTKLLSYISSSRECFSLKSMKLSFLKTISPISLKSSIRL
jgi:hypothetical protein